MIGVILYYFFKPFIVKPISSESLHNNINGALYQFVYGMYSTIVDYIKNFTGIISNNLFIFVTSLIILVFVFFAYIYYSISEFSQSFENNKKVNRDNRVSGIFKIYIWLASKINRKNIWLKRDLLLIDRLRTYTQMPLKLQYFIPPSFTSFLALYFVFTSQLDSGNYIISFWFLNAVLLYQITWLLQYAHPILNPSSELRQIDLIHLSPYYTYGEFMQSKIKLMQILIIPYQILVSVFFLLGALYVNIKIIDLLLGFAGNWLLFFLITIFSTWWLPYNARFDFKHILAVDINTVESRLLRMLYSIPKRLIIVGLLIPFFIVVFTDFSLETQLTHYVFYALIMLTFVSLFLYARIKNIKPRRDY